MVEPLEIHNMLGRTPLVEKTVAAHRDDAQQLALQAAAMQRQREHPEQKVEFKRESGRIEAEPLAEHRPESGAGSESGRGGEGASGGEEGVEWVQTPTDEPEHKLDVTI